MGGYVATYSSDCDGAGAYSFAETVSFTIPRVSPVAVTTTEAPPTTLRVDEPDEPVDPDDEVDASSPDEHAASASVDGPTEYGIIERDGNIYINGEPGRPLVLSRSDLPASVRDTLVTVGGLFVPIGPPLPIVTGDATVLIDGLAVVRVGDETSDGGIVVEGSSTVFINGVPAATVGEAWVVSPLAVGAVPTIGGPVISVGTTDCDAVKMGPLWYDGIARFQDALDHCMGELVNRFEMTQAAVEAGATTVDVRASRFEVGDEVAIGNDFETREHRTVVDKGSIVLDRPLENSYPAGTVVQRLGGSQPAGSDGGSATILVIAALVAAAFTVGAGLVWRMRSSKQNAATAAT
ncbi:MAG: hypothetical protein GY708_22945 [Actinomycetia bacterium]|nr:hypothetical protein [Actinomycetes bacterium]MCP4961921.1 hypothetical protein [Actinomycetes bacterium]